MKKRGLLGICLSSMTKQTELCVQVIMADTILHRNSAREALNKEGCGEVVAGLH